MANALGKQHSVHSTFFMPVRQDALCTGAYVSSDDFYKTAKKVLGCVLKTVVLGSWRCGDDTGFVMWLCASYRLHFAVLLMLLSAPQYSVTACRRI